MRVTARLGRCTGSCRSGRIEVTAAAGRKPKPGITVHRTRSLTRPDRTVIAAVPVTTVARTLVDLADVLSEERLAKAVHQAEILRVFDLEALEQAQAAGGSQTRAGIASPASSPPTSPSRTSCAARPSGG